MKLFIRDQLQRLVVPPTRVSRYLPPLAWALLLFILSSIPGNRYPEVRIVQFDKFVHFLMYMLLGFGLARAFSPATPLLRSSAGHTFTACLAGAFYGATDELHQLLVPNRSCSFADWIIDVLAVWAGAAVWLLVERLAKPEELRNAVTTPGESA